MWDWDWSLMILKKEMFLRPSTHSSEGADSWRGLCLDDCCFAGSRHWTVKWKLCKYSSLPEPTTGCVRPKARSSSTYSYEQPEQSLSILGRWGWNKTCSWWQIRIWAVENFVPVLPVNPLSFWSYYTVHNNFYTRLIAAFCCIEDGMIGATRNSGQRYSCNSSENLNLHEVFFKNILKFFSNFQNMPVYLLPVLVLCFFGEKIWKTYGWIHLRTHSNQSQVIMPMAKVPFRIGEI